MRDMKISESSGLQQHRQMMMKMKHVVAQSVPLNDLGDSTGLGLAFHFVTSRSWSHKYSLVSRSDSDQNELLN